MNEDDGASVGKVVRGWTCVRSVPTGGLILCHVAVLPDAMQVFDVEQYTCSMGDTCNALKHSRRCQCPSACS